MEFNDFQALRAAVRRECALVFAELGWAAEGTGPQPRFTQPGSAEIVHQLDIGGAVAPRGISVWGAVGVRHVTVCELIGQFTGELASGHAEETRDHLYPVFHYALRYVMRMRGPVTDDWRDPWVGTLDDVAPAVAKVRGDLDVYGMPLLAGYTTLTDVIGFLEPRPDRSPYQTRALAVAQALAGRTDDALDTLTQFAGWDLVAGRRFEVPYIGHPADPRFFAGFVTHFNIDPARVPRQVARLL